LRAATEAIIRGEFRPSSIPADLDDELGALGASLVELSMVMETRFEQLQRLSEVTRKVNMGLVLDEVLDYVYESFGTLIPYDRIGFALLEHQQAGTVVRTRWHRANYEDVHIGRGYNAPLQGSSLERIIDTDEPRIINDLSEYSRQHPSSHSTKLILKEGIRSSLTCPLITMGKPIGFVFFSSIEPNTYRDAHVELFVEIAGHLAVIVEKGRMYQQLLELNELKSRFLGMAAHDLRNPIGVVRGYVRLLTDEILGSVPENQRGVLTRVDSACQRMLSLIDDLLDITAIEQGQLTVRRRPTDLAELLRNCHTANELLARTKEIELVLELAGKLPEVVIDPDRIQQAINNLLDNAFKFSERGTRVTISAQLNDDWVRISVADQGPGLQRRDLPKLFLDFGRATSRPTAGERSTGLGLAIVKRLVEAHDGKVGVHSEIGIGSTFFISLPITAS